MIHAPRALPRTLAAALALGAACRDETPRIRAAASEVRTLGPEETPAPPPPRPTTPEAPAAQRLANAPAPTAAPEPEALGLDSDGVGGGGAAREVERAARMPAARRPAGRAAPARTQRGGALWGALDNVDGEQVAGFRRPAAQGSVNTATAAPAGVAVPVAPRGPGADARDLPAIDPNGRFATTYRPGRGHLAGFEASLARGEIPASARELVGDLGSRYAPEMPAPADRALALQADLSRAALAPGGGPLQLRIALRSTARPATARPPMSVHVVLDVSNSMAGDSIVNARRAAQELVERLQPSDHFSLVAFGGTASVRVPEGLVGPRRRQILDVIAGLQLEGGTNISAGLDLGYAECARGPQTPEHVRLVMLLSDGRPNAGETRADALAARAAQAFQDGVQTSAFGLGDDYDGPLMSAIAEQGAGGYYYVRDPQGIASSLTTELESRAQPVAQGVELRVRLRPDVRLTRAYGSRRLDAAESAAVRAQELAIDAQSERRDRIARDRQHDQEGGMRFFIPGFARDGQHVILLGLELPAGTGARPVATLELRYKDRLSRRNVTDELPVRVRFADSDAASAATADPSVQRTVQGFEAGEALALAARQVGAGDNPGAVASLSERASLLRAAARALSEPRLAEDAARLDRLRALVGGGGAMSQPLVLAMLLDTSARGMLH